MDGEPRKEKGTIVWGKEGRLIFSYLSEGKFPLDLLGGCLFGFVCKKKPTKLERFSREESSQRAPPFFFVDGGSMD